MGISWNGDWKGPKPGLPSQDATSQENLTLQLLPVQISTPVTTLSNTHSLPHPNHFDFQNDIWQSHHSTLCIPVLYCTFICIMFLIEAAFAESVVGVFDAFGSYGFGQVLGFLLLPVAGLIGVILPSLAIENTLGHRTRWVRRPLQIVLVPQLCGLRPRGIGGMGSFQAVVWFCVWLWHYGKGRLRAGWYNGKHGYNQAEEHFQGY